MSTKLNADEWYRKDQFNSGEDPIHLGEGDRETISMLERFAQPLADERDNLRKFIDALIQDVCWGRGLPDDMDGGSVQDMAERMGVLVKVPHTLPCDHIETCGCEGEDVDYLYNTPWNVKP